MLCFKVEMHVSVPAEQSFHLLSDLRRRKEWDQHYELVTTISILHYVSFFFSQKCPQTSVT